MNKKQINNQIKTALTDALQRGGTTMSLSSLEEMDCDTPFNKVPRVILPACKNALDICVECGSDLHESEESNLVVFNDILRGIDFDIDRAYYSDEDGWTI